MSKIVVKFGGTSVANTERIINAAKLIKQKIDEGHTIAVVVSAMAGVTNDLIKKSKEIDQEFNAEEYDALLASGEQVTSTLFAGALRKLAIKSRSFQSWQLPIVTEGSHKNSRIVYVETSKLNASLDKGEVPVIHDLAGRKKKWILHDTKISHIDLKFRSISRKISMVSKGIYKFKMPPLFRAAF